MRQVVEAAPRRAHGHLAVAVHVERRGDPRSEFPQVLPARRLAGIARVTGEDDAGRRVQEYGAANAAPPLLHVEVAELPVLFDKRQVRLPAQPTVDRQPGAKRPGVLRVQADIRAAVVEEDPVALRERLRAPDHEVRKREPGRRAAEGERTRGVDVGAAVDFLADEAAAETELVRAADEAQVLRELQPVGRRARRARAGVAERERAGDRHTQEAGHHVGHPDADVGSAELRDPRLLDVDAVVPEPERAHRIRVEKVGIADHDRLHRVVDRRREVGEHVVRIVVRLRLIARQLVAREDRVPAAHRVVHAPEREVLEVVRLAPEVHPTARVGRLRQPPDDVDRGRREERWSDAVVRVERRAQREGSSGVAGR